MGIDSQSIYPHSPRLYNTEKSWNPKNGFETDKVMDERFIYSVIESQDI